MVREFKDILKELRENKGLSQEELAKRLKVTRQTISNYERDVRSPEREMMENIADFFNVDMEYLYGRTNVKNRFGSELQLIGQLEPMHEYPYIPDPVAAGVPTTIEGLQELPKINIPNFLLDKYAGSKDILIMKISGNSMDKIIPDGALIAVHKDYPIENLKDNDIVVFNSDYDYGLKHYHDAGEYLIFKPNSNDANYKDIIIKKDECLSIVGKLVMYSVILD